MSTGLRYQGELDFIGSFGCLMIFPSHLSFFHQIGNTIWERHSTSPRGLADRFTMRRIPGLEDLMRSEYTKQKDHLPPPLFLSFCRLAFFFWDFPSLDDSPSTALWGNFLALRRFLCFSNSICFAGRITEKEHIGGKRRGGLLLGNSFF